MKVQLSTREAAHIRAALHLLATHAADGYDEEHNFEGLENRMTVEELTALTARFDEAPRPTIRSLVPAGGRGILVRADDPNIGIVATLEHLEGTAGILDVGLTNDGQLDIKWDGYTEVDWDGQKTAKVGGLRVFIDDEGNEVLEDNVMLVPENWNSEDEEEDE